MKPYSVNIAQADLDDLHERLRRTRWTREIAGQGWSRGVPLDYLKGLADYWLNDFDWRAAETEYNKHPQFVTEIDGQNIHFFHIRSSSEDALPLLLLPDNPGGVIGFLDVLDELSRDFHLVVPSCPGVGFSGYVTEPGWTVPRTAAAFAELMSKLGYERFGTQGGGGGANLGLELARQVPERVVGVHVNAWVAFPSPDESEFTADEQRRLGIMQNFMQEGLGFNQIMSTRPQTIAYGLTDSPVAQLAWIVEKFKEWTDSAAELPEDAFSRDRILTDVSIMWFTATAGSVANLYYDMGHDPGAYAPKPRVTVPTAVLLAKDDVTIRRFAERDADIQRWTELDRGGAYLALEVPDLLVADVRAFFGRLVEPASAASA
ncbi:epoxide hydrolase family protein [Microtetraspora malaysiensis]|uniref:epoxide hydrolase family protein n=1 Tax=Microtetraspora malaysiensis TaxID=161358 RepID=UPI00082B6CF8|nr:epoxide hydrolase N-terminal domain-containing protein [Microtetraspora malaysiensis]